MNKLLLAVALTLISSSASAEWTLVLNKKESTQYVDIATIVISGNNAKIGSLTNISENLC